MQTKVGIFNCFPRVLILCLFPGVGEMFDVDFADTRAVTFTFLLIEVEQTRQDCADEIMDRPIIGLSDILS